MMSDGFIISWHQYCITLIAYSKYPSLIHHFELAIFSVSPLMDIASALIPRF